MPERDVSPATEAGRALWGSYDDDAIWTDITVDDMRAAILAIEHEAAAIDPERLAEAIGEAMSHVPWPGERGTITFGGLTFRAAAQAVAAAYLSPPSSDRGASR